MLHQATAQCMLIAAWLAVEVGSFCVGAVQAIFALRGRGAVGGLSSAAVQDYIPLVVGAAQLSTWRVLQMVQPGVSAVFE